MCTQFFPLTLDARAARHRRSGPNSDPSLLATLNDAGGGDPSIRRLSHKLLLDPTDRGPKGGDLEVVMSSPITLVPYPDVASPPPRPHEILSSPSDEITHEHEGLPRVRSRETYGVQRGSH
jgi:hypothetical protein